MVVKRVGPLSCAKIAGVLYAALGGLIGVIVALFSLSGALAGNSGFGALLGVGAIVIAPVFYGCLGFVFALVAAALYNFAVGVVGGVELDLQ